MRGKIYKDITENIHSRPTILPQAYCSLLSSGYSAARRLLGREQIPKLWNNIY